MNYTILSGLVKVSNLLLNLFQTQIISLTRTGFLVHRKSFSVQLLKKTLFLFSAQTFKPDQSELAHTDASK